MKKVDCFNCKYISYDFDSNGYCNYKDCSNYRHVIVDDRGSKVMFCKNFDERFNCEDDNR